MHADAIAEAHRHRLAHLDTLARDADEAGYTALAHSYRDRNQRLGADSPAIDITLTHAATARDDAHAALLAIAGAPDQIVTDNQMRARRLEALQADAAELNAARIEAHDLDNQLWRAEAAAARAFAEPRTAVSLDVEVSRLRAEVDYLDSAGGVSGAGMYPPPADRYASVPERDRQAVAAVAGGAQSVQVLTVGAAADKAAALTAIAAAARTKQHRILALPTTAEAKNFFDEHSYADGTNTPQIAHDKFAAGQWTAPPGTLIVVDDADHLTAAQKEIPTLVADWRAGHPVHA